MGAILFAIFVAILCNSFARGLILPRGETPSHLEDTYRQVFQEIHQRNHPPQPPIPVYGVHFPQNQAQKLENLIGDASSVNIRAFEVMVGGQGLPPEVAANFLRSKLPPICFLEQNPAVGIASAYSGGQRSGCDPEERYRRIDGTCNNLANPYLGAPNTRLKRLLPPDYEDGWNSPRGGYHRKGSSLPNARLVSSNLHQDLPNLYPDISSMVPLIGQFLDHDIAITPEESKKCCGPDMGHVNCWPIQIYDNDRFYASLPDPQHCLSFTRSTPFCFPESSGTIRQQMNGVTSYIDASHIYGSDTNTTALLRSWSQGKFRTNSKCPNLLPTVDEVDGVDASEFKGEFFAGEVRTNIQPGLTIFHTIFFREHNRICDGIVAEKPHWGDERIFQEARRILTGIWQNIIYSEYLPVILGQDAMDKYDLRSGQRSDYDEGVDTSIINEFTTAAYRFGHSMIQGGVLLKRGFNRVGSFPLSSFYFNSELIHINGGEGFDLILNGLLEQNAQRVDPFVTKELSDFLFREKGKDFGGDLISRNIQRGRDHGLPGYSAYRVYCGLPQLYTWSERPSNILEGAWVSLQRIYKTPGDIDLFSGGLSEIPVPGALTGHTFNCIKGLQFRDLKFGDRFFYTHQHSAIYSFTNKELEELSRISLGDILCLNSRVEMISRDVFRVNSRSNPLIHCRDTSRPILRIGVFLRD